MAAHPRYVAAHSRYVAAHPKYVTAHPIYGAVNPKYVAEHPNMCLHIPSKIFTQYMGPFDHNKILTLIAKLPKSYFDYKTYTEFFHDGNYCFAYKKEHLAAHLGV